MKRFFFGLPDVIFLAVLTAALLAAFWPVFSNGFVNFDDDGYIMNNTTVRSGLTAAGIHWAFTTFHLSNWHPLTWISHMVDVELFGLSPRGHHLVNLMLHLACSALLYIFLKRVTGDFRPAALAASFFALHPLRVESVAWASERKDVLSAVIFLLTLLAYVRYTCSPGTVRYALVFLSAVLGLLAKPMLVTLPILLLLLDYWPLRRLRLDGVSVSGSAGFSIWELLWEKAPLVILSAASSGITLIAQSRGGSIDTTIPLAGRLANAAISPLWYFGKMFWPENLSFFYPLRMISLWQSFGAATVLIALTLIILKLGTKQRFLVTGWLWYLVSLLPVIGLVQIGPQSAADRYTYLPMVGVVIIIAWGTTRLMGQNRRNIYRYFLVTLSLILFIVLGLMTNKQTRVWHDNESLFIHGIRATKDNWLALNNLGVTFLYRGDVVRATVSFKETIRLRPSYAKAHFNLGDALYLQGNIEDAAASYRVAIGYKPTYYQAYAHLGRALALSGKLNEAHEILLRAEKINPRYGETYLFLGNIAKMRGDTAAAIGYYNRARLLDPSM